MIVQRLPTINFHTELASGMVSVLLGYLFYNRNKSSTLQFHLKNSLLPMRAANSANLQSIFYYFFSHM